MTERETMSIARQELKNLFLVILGVILIANLVVLDVVLLLKNKAPLATPTSIGLSDSNIKTQEEKLESKEFVSKTEEEEVAYRLICQDEISKALATISATPKETVKTIYQQTPAASHPSVVYISLGGSSSTTVHEWQETGSTEAYFDKADYAGAKKITFEAFLKVKHGAGQADARLYDASHGFVISGSELLGGGADQFEKKSSGPLALLPGNNLYKVQLRSTTGYEVFIESPRLKIEY